MVRVVLTERFIHSPKRIPTTGRQYFADALVPGMKLCATDKGHLSFVLTKRYPLSPRHPTHRCLGEVGEITLDQARDKAREWLAMIKKGIDPKTEEARLRAEAARRQVNSFAAV